MVKSVTLYAVAAALAAGARRVRYIDGDERALAAAATLGAEVMEHHGGWPRHFDRALITVDGYFGKTTPMPLLEMYTRGVTFHVSRADSRRLLPEVLGLVASGRLDPLAIPTTVIRWDEAPRVWLEPATKLVLVR